MANKNKKEFFPIIELAREDINNFVDEIGAENFSDELMEKIADELGERIKEQGIWSIARDVCKDFGLLK